MKHLLIYVEQSTNRLKYTFDLLFNCLLGVTVETTSDKNYFLASSHAKLSYASQPVGDELFFESTALLFETNIYPQPINFCKQDHLQGFYPVSSRSTISFDLFASAFFLVSRYEEYLPAQKDKYGRYRASYSMNYKAGFLEKPMVNYYACELKKILSSKYPELEFNIGKFEYKATFDIDIAYSYLDKGIKRNLGGFVRSLLLSDVKEFKERLAVLVGTQKDPYDTYDYIFDVCNKFSIPTMFFFLLGDNSRFDKNLKHTKSRFRKLVEQVSAKTETGIHLSFKSHVDVAICKEEMVRLEEISGKPVNKNRYHYLRFHLPLSYEKIIDLGILEDYSMAYAPRIGFRAGITSPYYFFNVATNTTTLLKIYPVAFMDATFKHYNRLLPVEALQKIRELMHSVHECGGTFIGLWHNSSLSENKEWKGWRKVFEMVADEAAGLMKK